VEVLEGSRPVRELPVTLLVPDTLGLNVYMSLPALHGLMQEDRSISGAFLETDPAFTSQLYHTLKETPRAASVTLKQAALKNFRDTVGENLMLMRLFNMIFASIIAFGVVYNSARISLSERSRELASALLASPERKRWILVQSRMDLVGQNAELLRQWRPLARNFDIFLGFESPTSEGLRSLQKGADIARTVEAVRVARELGFGVTGNFIIDPDYTEEDFRLLWDFLDAHQLYRVGFTILTPLPGTEFFEQSREKLQVFDWNQYDLHHLLWQPRLPVERFFELYCETWKRTVLNAAGRKKWWKWMAEVEIRQVGRMLRILRRTQHMLDPRAYLAEAQIPLAPSLEGQDGRRLAR